MDGGRGCGACGRSAGWCGDWYGWQRVLHVLQWDPGAQGLRDEETSVASRLLSSKASFTMLARRSPPLSRRERTPNGPPSVTGRLESRLNGSQLIPTLVLRRQNRSAPLTKTAPAELMKLVSELKPEPPTPNGSLPRSASERRRWPTFSARPFHTMRSDLKRMTSVSEARRHPERTGRLAPCQAPQQDESGVTETWEFRYSGIEGVTPARVGGRNSRTDLRNGAQF